MMQRILLALVSLLVIPIGIGRAGMIEGGVAYEAGDYQSAAQHFRRVIEADPLAAYAFMLLGRSLDHLGEPEQALSHLNRARQLLPHDPDILQALSLHYSRTHALAEAAVFAGKAFHQAPHRTDLVALAGWASLEAGDDERAVDLLSRITNPSMNTVVAMTLARLRMRRQGDALQGLVQALDPDPLRETSPTSGQLVREYTRWLLSQGCIPAQDIYRDLEEQLFDIWVAETEPLGSEAQIIGLWRSVLMIKRRDPEQALEHLQGVLSQDPDSCAGHYYQALALGQMSRSTLDAELQACQGSNSAPTDPDLDFPALNPRDLTPLTISIREHVWRLQDHSEAAHRTSKLPDHASVRGRR